MSDDWFWVYSDAAIPTITIIVIALLWGIHQLSTGRARPKRFRGDPYDAEDATVATCPVDGTPCVDDICHGAGCQIDEYHELPLVVCDGCGALVPLDEPCDECSHGDGEDRF